MNEFWGYVFNVLDLLMAFIFSVSGFLMLIGTFMKYDADSFPVVFLGLGMIYVGIRLTNRVVNS